MSPAKKPRNSAKSSKNQYSAELSPSQLVLGIAILLIFGLACFLFGVLVGKFDPSLNERVVRVPDADQMIASSAVPETTASRPSSTSTPKESASPPSESTTPSSKPVEEKTMVVKREPVKPATKPTKPSTSIPESATVTTTDLPPDKPAEPEPAKAEEPEPAKVDVPAGTPAANATIVTAQATEAPTTPKPTEPEAPTGPVWSVQLAAFKDGANAETEKARLEKRMPYKIEVYKPASSPWTKVLVGRYATRAEADAFRKKLIASYQVKDPGLFERK